MQMNGSHRQNSVGGSLNKAADTLILLLQVRIFQQYCKIVYPPYTVHAYSIEC